jgi:hypothetical protein
MGTVGYPPAETNPGGGIVTVRDELQARILFEQRYGIAAAPAARRIERRVIGGDWAPTGTPPWSRPISSPQGWSCRPPTVCWTSAPAGLAGAVPGRPHRLFDAIIHTDVLC